MKSASRSFQRLRFVPLFGLLAAAMAQAGPPQPAPVQVNLAGESTVAQWQARTLEIHGLLRTGKSRNAIDAADSLVREITQQAAARTDLAQLLAEPLSLRAVARAGAGKDREALWDFQMAMALWPGLDRARLTGLGAGGARLATLLDEAEKREVTFALAAETIAHRKSEVTPPKPQRHDSPLYPESLQTVMKQGVAEIRFTLDEKGLLQSPQLVANNGQNALFLLACMQAVRDWRFTPAKLRGEPIAVSYSLVLNYHR
ncbi:MAG: energy transducer TonB [Thermoanaerobaculia bacterium]